MLCGGGAGCRYDVISMYPQVDRMAADEELSLMRDQEEARKQAIKAMNEQKCDLELELRQVSTKTCEPICKIRNL